MYKKFNWRLLIIIVFIVVLIVAPYVLRFCGCFSGLPCCELSSYPEYWGAFGSYFGGMMSVISIILLYHTLNEQRRANYRSSFESSYTRLFESYLENIKDEGGTFKKVFENICLNAKQATSAAKINSTPREKLKTIWDKIKQKYKRDLAYLDAYCGFLHIVHRIAFDDNLDFPTKKLYLHDFEHSLPMPVLMSILIRLCSKYDEKEKQAIELFKKYDMLRDLQIENATIDDAKNLLLGYEKKKKPNFLLMLIENAKHINLNF